MPNSQPHKPRSASAKERTALRKEINRTEQDRRERRNRALRAEGQPTPWQQAQQRRANLAGRSDA